MKFLYLLFRRIRTVVYTKLFLMISGKKARNIKISSFDVVNINGPFSLSDGFFSGESLYISTNKYCSLKIDGKVMFGPNVMILGGNHNVKFSGSHIYDFKEDMPDSRDIVISRGCWVGARTTILSGAIISEGAVIGAGSIVSHYVPPYVVAVGSPAKKYIARFNKKELERILSNVDSELTVFDVEKIYEKYCVTVNE